MSSRTTESTPPLMAIRIEAPGSTSSSLMSMCSTCSIVGMHASGISGIAARSRTTKARRVRFGFWWGCVCTGPEVAAVCADAWRSSARFWSGGWGVLSWPSGIVAGAGALFLRRCLRRRFERVSAVRSSRRVLVQLVHGYAAGRVWIVVVDV